MGAILMPTSLERSSPHADKSNLEAFKMFKCHLEFELEKQER